MSTKYDSEKRKHYVEKNKEKFKEYDRKHYLKYIEKKKLSQRKRNIKFRYGITLEEYLTWCEEVEHSCEICGIYTLDLCVDHNHETKKLRGLICRNCNSAMGLAKDSIELLEIMVEYLKKYV